MASTVGWSSGCLGRLALSYGPTILSHLCRRQDQMPRMVYSWNCGSQLWHLNFVTAGRREIDHHALPFLSAMGFRRPAGGDIPLDRFPVWSATRRSSPLQGMIARSAPYTTLLAVTWINSEKTTTCSRAACLLGMRCRGRRLRHKHRHSRSKPTFHRSLLRRTAPRPSGGRCRGRNMANYANMSPPIRSPIGPKNAIVTPGRSSISPLE